MRRPIYTFTSEQREELIDELREYRNEEHIDFGKEMGGVYVEVYGNIDLEGYREKETGGYIETHREADIEITVYNNVGDEMDADYDTEEKVKEMLEQLEYA